MATEMGETVHGRPGVIATLLLIVGVVPFMAILFGLYTALGVGMPYFGLLFLVYWAAILRQDPAAYLPSLLGGLSGILLGWVFVAMPPLVGSAGMPIAAVVLVAMLFCFMRGQVPLVVNNSTMLFLTVATIPQLNVARNIVVMVESLMVAAIYMGGVAALVHFITTRRKPQGADETATTA